MIRPQIIFFLFFSKIILATPASLKALYNKNHRKKFQMDQDICKST